MFTLRALGDAPYAKIASLFGKGENWARVVYFRAHKQLLERMEKEERKWAKREIAILRRI